MEAPVIRTAAAVVAVVALLAACGGRGEPEGPEPPPPPPDLTGATVMLLPMRTGSPGQLDAELAFWLGDRAPHTTWLLPADLQRVIDRTPAWRVRLETLPRAVVEIGGSDRRIADPLYGELRRLGAMTDVDLALVPIAAQPVTDSAGTALDLTAALVDIRGGRVLWLATVRGGPAPEPAGAAATAAAAALARALVPW